MHDKGNLTVLTATPSLDYTGAVHRETENHDVKEKIAIFSTSVLEMLLSLLSDSQITWDSAPDVS